MHMFILKHFKSYSILQLSILREFSYEYPINRKPTILSNRQTDYAFIEALSTIKQFIFVTLIATTDFPKVRIDLKPSVYILTTKYKKLLLFHLQILEFNTTIS